MKSRIFPVFFLLILLFAGSSVSWGGDKKSMPPREGNQKIVKFLWSRTLQNGKSHKRYFPEMASPVLDGGILYVGTHAGIFYAVDAQKGKTLWQTKTSGPIAARAVVSGGNVYFGNNKGDVYSLNASNGNIQWTLFVGGEILGSLAVGNGEVYVVNTSREVSAINFETGALRWSTYVKGFEKKVSMRGNASVVLSGGRLFIGFADGQVAALSPHGGEILWSQNFAAPSGNFWDIDASVLAEGGVLYVIGYSGGLEAISPTGQTVWKTSAKQVSVKSGTDMGVDDHALYVSSVDGKVLAFDKKTGKRLWQSPLGGAFSSFLLVGDKIIVGTQRNWGFVLNKQNGKSLQKFSIPSGFLSEGVSQGTGFYFLSGGAHLMAATIQ